MGVNAQADARCRGVNRLHLNPKSRRPAPATPTHPAAMDKERGRRMSTYDGLTKREQLAAMAMQGLMHIPPNGHLDGRGDDTDIARWSVRYADALLAELAKAPPQ